VLQQLVAQTGANGWAIASMLFFLVVWLVVAVRVWRALPEQMTAYARLPLCDEGAGELPEGTGPQA
jgi:hypothetical protein